MLGSHGEGVKDPKAGKLDNSLFFERVVLPYVCVCATCVYIGMCVCPEWCLAVSKDSSMTSFPGSVQFSHSILSDSLQHHGLQHTRPPIHHQLSGVHSNSCPLSQWCYPTISSSVTPFSSCLQSFPVSGSFQMSQFFTSGGQSIGASASESVLPMNIQDWFPLGWSGWIPCSPRDSQESSPTPQFKSINSLALSFLYSPTLTSIHDYWKNHSLN